MMFRELSEAEAAEFRKWARQNYDPGSEISNLWHPVIREECERINAEIANTITPQQLARWDNETTEKREITKKIFKATIDVFVEAEVDAEACDGLAEAMREIIKKYAPRSCIVNWQYNPASMFPVEATEAEIDQIER